MYKKKPLVSVIIPVFNGSVFVAQAVASVQKSTFKNFEILLVDDGSTDRSKEICHVLEKKYKNVKFYSFPRNKGLGRTLNFALSKARGKYICRLNQDDLMLKNRLKTQVDFLEKNTAVVALGSWIKIFTKSTRQDSLLKFLKTDEEIKKVWYIVGPFADPSVMYRKAIALKVGGYVQAMWPADDTHLWYRMGMIGKLANIQKPLVEVRWHNNAASFKYFRKLALSTYKMHLWTNKYVKKAPLVIQLFWLGQLVCGLVLPAKINWLVYLKIKKVINNLQLLNGLGANTLTKKIAVATVINQPKKASFSGV